MSIGRIFNDFLDKFLPDIVGDVLGAVVDGVTGNVGGAVMNSMDAVEDVLDAAGADRAADLFGDIAHVGVGAGAVESVAGGGEVADGLGAVVSGVLA